MGKCLECGKTIDDKYQFCFDCVKKQKTKSPVESSEAICSELQKINNNLYALRTIAEYVLQNKFYSKLIWDKQNKKFKIE